MTKNTAVHVEAEFARLRHDYERLQAEYRKCIDSLQAAIENEKGAHQRLRSLLGRLQAHRTAFEQASHEWKDAFDAVRHPIFIHDSDFHIVRANREYLHAAGLPFEAIVGRPYWEVFPRRAGPFPGCLAALAKEEDIEEELRLEDGRIFVSHSYYIHETGGGYRYSVHLLEDVTAQRAVAAERRTLAEALQQAAEGMILIGPDLRIRYANPAFADLTARPLERLKGEPISNFIRGGWVGCVPDSDAACVPARWSGTAELRVDNGADVPVHFTASAVRGAGNEIVAYLGNCVDLRPIKSAEAALADSEARYRSLFENMQSAFVLHDVLYDGDGNPVDYRFVAANPALKDVTGLAPEAVIGKTLLEVLPGTEADWKEAYAQVARTGGPIRFERYAEDLGRYYDVLAFRPQSGRLASICTDITARVRAETALRRVNRALKTLSRSNQALVRSENEEDLLRHISHAVVEEGGYRRAWVGYRRGDSTEVDTVVNAGEPQEDDCGAWIKNDDIKGACAEVIASGNSVVWQDLARDPSCRSLQRDAAARGYRSMVAFPLQYGRRTFGVLGILAEEADAFDSQELAFLSELADDLAYGISTLRIRQERKAFQAAHQHGEQALRETLTGTIEALALALEKRDPYTSGHQRRVGRLAAAIGRELGLSDDRIEGLRLGGLIHDIGKIAVPSEILNRPGRLSDAEFVLIKNHSLAGYEIVKDIAFPWPVAQMVLQHHERPDGSGYPKGLSAEGTILEARILAVADVVEAISSHRPYRPALGLQVAMEEIRQNRGHYYDADVVDACVRVLRSGSLSLAD